ncbi:hypothetical protein C479_12489 [Halovivax asiaticus JCM 14624]|uniref:Uncharacterized protein n=1 Tax=Halovivax asiaticus JCM 14624 TaxID=1227490 RepID=M0BH17_9EURY|nr:hypothetical protein C479_12489 [Halovivax asiaticus JCM 14624]
MMKNLVQTVPIRMGVVKRGSPLIKKIKHQARKLLVFLSLSPRRSLSIMKPNLMARTISLLRLKTPELREISA